MHIMLQVCKREVTLAIADTRTMMQETGAVMKR